MRLALRPLLALLAVALTAGLAAGCAGGGEAEGLRLDLDKQDPERLLRYYLGGYVAPGGGDPFEAGLVREEGGAYLLDPDALRATLPDAAGDRLDAAAVDGVVDWDEFAALVQATYYAARGLPPTLDALRAETAYRADSSAWFRVVLDGVMTTARRHLFVPADAVRAALRDYEAQGGALRYPVGTTIVGEHRVGDDLAETTLMRKRADGFWDFAVYDAAGRLAPSTTTPPRPLDAPTQCAGCHFGDRPFEPAKSFPAAAPPGPHGPRAVLAPDVEVDPALVRRFDEHRRRSDTVLGLYATLYVAQLQEARRAGTLAPDDAALLDALDL